MDQIEIPLQPRIPEMPHDTPFPCATLWLANQLAAEYLADFYVDDDASDIAYAN